METLKAYRICNRCIMDTTDPEITFYDNGYCNHCVSAMERFEKQILSLEQREKALSDLVAIIKKEGLTKEYDCIIGVSGGVDSTTVAYQVKKLGLRALAVHFDNGWDSELAVDNIRNILNNLGIDLFTYVVDWEEFKDIQLSFIKAGVVNCEGPTDHGITATLFRTANRFQTRFILSGSNLVTEAIMPISWAYYNQDLKNLKAIHKRFGTKKMVTFPKISIFDYLYFVFIKKIRQIPFLNYIDYNKQRYKEILTNELGWRDYGGKHYESVWTRFYQGYYLPRKFGYDKRRAHLSTLVISNQMKREDALAEMEKPIYDEVLLKTDMEYVIKKFNLSSEEFESFINAQPKKHHEYPNHYYLFHKFGNFKNIFRKIATSA